MVKKINKFWKSYQKNKILGTSIGDSEIIAKMSKNIDNFGPPVFGWITLLLFAAASYGALTSDTNLLLYSIFGILLLK